MWAGPVDGLPIADGKESTMGKDDPLPWGWQGSVPSSPDSPAVSGITRFRRVAEAARTLVPGEIVGTAQGAFLRVSAQSRAGGAKE